MTPRESFNNLGERMVKIETDIDYIKQSQEEMKKQMSEFIKSADKKYASKLSEKITYGLVGAILIYLLNIGLQHLFTK